MSYNVTYTTYVDRDGMGVLGISPPNIAKPSENLAIRGL
jgi:hypothetical protein